MEIAILFALIVLNGLFAMSEISLVTARRARMQKLVDEGDGAAAAAVKLGEDPTRFLSTIQIGITSIGVLNGIVGEAALAAPLATWLEAIGLHQPYDDSISTPAQPGCGCRIDVHAARDVHVHQHCGEASTPPAGPGGDTAPCYPPAAEGNTCLPPVAGSKHKQSPAQKRQRRLAQARVPSMLAASTMALVRRFLEGAAPANPLEQAAFARLRQADSEALQTLRCASDRFAGVTGAERAALFDDGFPAGQPVSPDTLAVRLGLELAQRASLAAFGEVKAFEDERPGQVRVFTPGVEDFFVQVRICSINNLRTDDFIPPVPIGSYRPDEVAHDCTTTLVNGVPQVSCTVRTGNCNGPQVPGLCLRTPVVASGQAVLLQGVNFFSIEAQVQLTPRAGGAPLLLDAHVFGDVVTPVTETFDGKPRLINDCRVGDRLSFQVPADTAPGLYDMQVVVPNITGIPQFGERLLSNAEVLEVAPPSSARFSIAAELLDCRKETAPASFGSDEVGLRFLAVPLLADLSTGALQTTTRRFGDVDSGDSRRIDRVFFQSQQPILGVALTVLGHEVDGEEAYNNMVTSVSDLFVDLVKEQALFAKDALKAAGIGASQLAGLGTTGAIVVGIAIAITLAVDLIIALWAPADLIIEDPSGYALLDLAERTGADFPAPTTPAFRTEGGIDVKVTPVEKIPLQYRERREYASSDEESRYAIVYRFNRTA